MSQVTIRRRLPGKPPERLQRTISIRQPLVEQILTGTKKREFRSRPTRIRERVYLYATKKLAEGAREMPALATLPKGRIVGSVEIADSAISGIASPMSSRTRDDTGFRLGHAVFLSRVFDVPERVNHFETPG
ncbi:MAG: hypothetical protein ACRD45_19660 [Bryobacteraceae bacterium]